MRDNSGQTKVMVKRLMCKKMSRTPCLNDCHAVISGLSTSGSEVNKVHSKTFCGNSREEETNTP